MTPERIQLRRTKGWRKPEGAVVVARPSKWGNPFRVVPVRRSGPFDLLHGELFVGQYTGIESARRSATERFRCAVNLGWGDVPWPDEIRDSLCGRDLACWCPLDQPCHADVLLEIANGTPQ